VKRILALFLALLASISLISCSAIDLTFEDVRDEVVGFADIEEEVERKIENIDKKIKEIEEKVEEDIGKIEENGTYTTKEDVGLYIHTYDKLPNNFIKKRDATDLGWESSKGNLWDLTDKKSIGGDKFGNREKRLPIKDGRIYYECDINYKGAYRGAERIVYSNDGLVYYTGDHYETFILLYGDENL